jgi:hypothetical protein
MKTNYGRQFLSLIGIAVLMALPVLIALYAPQDRVQGLLIWALSFLFAPLVVLSVGVILPEDYYGSEEADDGIDDRVTELEDELADLFREFKYFRWVVEVAADLSFQSPTANQMIKRTLVRLDTRFPKDDLEDVLKEVNERLPRDGDNS